MKILRVITRMNIGGPAHQVNYLHGALRERGHEADLVVGSLDEGEGDAGLLLIGQAGVRAMPELCRPIRPWLDSVAFLKLFKILCTQPYEVCHTHTAKAGLLARMAAWAAIPCRKLRKYPKLKTVHTYHGHVFKGYFSPRMSGIICRIERWLASRTSVLITLTPELQRDIAGHLGLSRKSLTVVPLGLNLTPYLAVQRERIFELNFKNTNINSNININIDMNININIDIKKNNEAKVDSPVSRVIGWVGRFSAIKNPMRFVTMAEHLKKIYAGPIVFVMVGDGPLRGQIEEELQRRRLSEIFCLTGWRSDLTTVYSGFDVLVNTSDNEGTPVAVLEALSSGLPVVATDVGGTAEILNYPNEPVMCFALDEEAKACEVLADWLREGRRISVETRRAVVEEFSQQKLLERLLKIYGADG